MKNFNAIIILRMATAIILITHSIFGMFNGGIQQFGDLYLNQMGFDPIGVPLAWGIKLIHLIGALFLIINRHISIACILNIWILIMGVVLVHFKEGWFVVGGGRNGMEYSFLLICVLATILISDGKRKIIN